MDYSDVANSIAETIAKVSKPLTMSQKIAMAGAVAVYLEIAREQGKKESKDGTRNCKQTLFGAIAIRNSNNWKRA